MSIVITGRPISATVANFRQIDWREGGLSFRLLFSPGVVENAPQTAMGNINVIEGTANDVESRPGTAFPTLSFIPVGDALERIEDILSSLVNAVALVGGRSQRRGNLGYPNIPIVGSPCALRMAFSSSHPDQTMPITQRMNMPISANVRQLSRKYLPGFLIVSTKTKSGFWQWPSRPTVPRSAC